MFHPSACDAPAAKRHEVAMGWAPMADLFYSGSGVNIFRAVSPGPENVEPGLRLS
jgi:hypothetical protein